VRACRLYAFRLPADTFRPHATGGYWVSGQAVTASERVDVGDLLGRPAVRVTPSVWPYWRRVAESTVEFSGVRLRNAGGQAERG
jgi:hypothetical protein